MKKVLLILSAIILFSCSNPPSNYISAERGDVVITKIKYEGHDYLVFRGSDYFSAVVHSASCEKCSKQ